MQRYVCNEKIKIKLFHSLISVTARFSKTNMGKTLLTKTYETDASYIFRVVQRKGLLYVCTQFRVYSAIKVGQNHLICLQAPAQLW